SASGGLTRAQREQVSMVRVSRWRQDRSMPPLHRIGGTDARGAVEMGGASLTGSPSLLPSCGRARPPLHHLPQHGVRGQVSPRRKVLDRLVTTRSIQRVTAEVPDIEVPVMAVVSRYITVTEGNLRNSHLYLTEVMDLFPPDVLGGEDKSRAAAHEVVIECRGETVQTDIVRHKNMFRRRGW